MRTLALAATLVTLATLAVPAAAQPAKPPQPAQPAQPAQPRQPAQARPAPRYLAAIDAELSALGIAHACEADGEVRARCSFIQRGRTSQREIAVHLVYSDDTDTVFIYVGRVVMAPPEAETTPAVLRRLMELNWELVAAKLEWNEADGEVRLSMVLHTDSNFDRRAFRSLVRQIVPLADRYVGELDRLAAE